MQHPAIASSGVKGRIGERSLGTTFLPLRKAVYARMDFTATLRFAGLALLR
jgi:hypothetical protein